MLLEADTVTTAQHGTAMLLNNELHGTATLVQLIAQHENVTLQKVDSMGLPC